MLFVGKKTKNKPKKQLFKYSASLCMGLKISRNKTVQSFCVSCTWCDVQHRSYNSVWTI